MNLGKVGRLGNALFELASTIGIADAVGEPPYFPWDWIHRPYFSLEPALFGDDIRNLPAHMLESDMKTVRPEFRGAGAVMPPVNPREATEFATHIDIRARGYLQDIRLFWPSIGKIRDWLKPSPLAQATLASYPLPQGRSWLSMCGGETMSSTRASPTRPTTTPVLLRSITARASNS